MAAATITRHDWVEAAQTAGLAVRGLAEPYATWEAATDTWTIADDADWVVPGLHRRYRAALQAALTRCPSSWAEVGAGVAVSGGGYWSGRAMRVYPQAGIIETSPRDGDGAWDRFVIRDAELAPMRARIDALLAMRTVLELPAAERRQVASRPEDYWWGNLTIIRGIRVPTLNGTGILAPGVVLSWDGRVPPSLHDQEADPGAGGR